MIRLRTEAASIRSCGHGEVENNQVASGLWLFQWRRCHRQPPANLESSFLEKSADDIANGIASSMSKTLPGLEAGMGVGFASVGQVAAC